MRALGRYLSKELPRLFPAFALLLAGHPLQAQTIRDTVQRHLNEGLEGQPADADAPAAPKQEKKKAAARSRHPAAETQPDTPETVAPAQTPEPEAPVAEAAEDALP